MSVLGQLNAPDQSILMEPSVIRRGASLDSRQRCMYSLAASLPTSTRNLDMDGVRDISNHHATLVFHPWCCGTT